MRPLNKSLVRMTSALTCVAAASLSEMRSNSMSRSFFVCDSSCWRKSRTRALSSWMWSLWMTSPSLIFKLIMAEVSEVFSTITGGASWASRRSRADTAASARAFDNDSVVSIKLAFDCAYSSRTRANSSSVSLNVLFNSSISMFSCVILDAFSFSEVFAASIADDSSNNAFSEDALASSRSACVVKSSSQVFRNSFWLRSLSSRVSLKDNSKDLTDASSSVIFACNASFSRLASSFMAWIVRSCSSLSLLLSSSLCTETVVVCVSASAVSAFCCFSIISSIFNLHFCNSTSFSFNASEILLIFSSFSCVNFNCSVYFSVAFSNSFSFSSFAFRIDSHVRSNSSIFICDALISSSCSFFKDLIFISRSFCCNSASFARVSATRTADSMSDLNFSVSISRSSCKSDNCWFTSSNCCSELLNMFCNFNSLSFALVSFSRFTFSKSSFNFLHSFSAFSCAVCNSNSFPFNFSVECILLSRSNFNSLKANSSAVRSFSFLSFLSSSSIWARNKSISVFIFRMSSGEGAGESNCVLLLLLLLLEISRNVADEELEANFSFSFLNFITSSRKLFALSLYSRRVDWSQFKLSWKRGDWKSFSLILAAAVTAAAGPEGVAGVFLPPIFLFTRIKGK